MHKLVLVSMIVITAATSFAAPSFAQSAGGKGRGGGGGHSSSDSSDWYPGIGSFTHGNDNYNRRRPRVILTKSGAYCVENRRWVDASGTVHVSPYRECRNRVDIAID
ncbi:hypothetical protein MZK49_21065 [Ensifer sesbaniae]|jgi:hypothetical protein|uniref:hypothetical protein n=1 Tax=Ensifer sesbaniae TaxID=1214071 RepID=UPI001567EFD7|nr:hypothetical protein [Ensifer sesbaniae]MCK3779201.1 hypothetical protein [Ensifer sesbaniae]NRQ18531.1 hypothetical protein [Ensifer sesbaniae]